MRVPELRTITDGVAGSLARGIQEEVKIIDFLPTDEVLRYSVCGLATAALQEYLREQYQVQTTRVIIDLPERSPSLQNRHVFLRHNRAITIDPTYGQFFEYAGMSVIDLVERPELAALYPEAKIAVIEDAEAKRFIGDLALRAYAAGQEAQGEASSSVEELESLFSAVWMPKVGRRFNTPVDAMVDRIIAKMNGVS